MSYPPEVAALLKEQADGIRKHLNDAAVTVFGEPIDLSDPDTLLVAAFALGKDMGYKKAVEFYDYIDDSEVKS